MKLFLCKSIEKVSLMEETSDIKSFVGNIMIKLIRNLFYRHFFGTVLQFQIFRSLCMASREYDPLDPRKPLHKCDIYRHPEAGDIIK